ncbi:hypothetical protein O181_065001 [Austropuccinia psidii MF-1]|uniref:Uncharacterized protein n=1 Tax=Austropuccinia psidii MF-1 TaxID=1389203 RepID=A0A9Q3EN44_9BASI|nr:hypothetical protein [Austropuccinia psidii MF-1]
MDLPPLPFNACLEEQWDEQEDPDEIEIMLKVAPSAYHQYSNIFSSLKEEKLPPHHACENLIEIEGLSPPVSVIYSISNRESETLQAYIPENVKKGLIRQSSSSTRAPVLFVKKRMVAFVFVLPTTNSMMSLGRTGILFLLCTSFLLYSTVQLSSPRFICMV